MYDKIIERVQNRLCFKVCYPLCFCVLTSGEHLYPFLFQPTVRSRRIFSLLQTTPSTYFDIFFIPRHLFAQNKMTLMMSRRHTKILTSPSWRREICRIKSFVFVIIWVRRFMRRIEYLWYIWWWFSPSKHRKSFKSLFFRLC